MPRFCEEPFCKFLFVGTAFELYLALDWHSDDSAFEDQALTYKALSLKCRQTAAMFQIASGQEESVSGNHNSTESYAIDAPKAQKTVRIISKSQLIIVSTELGGTLQDEDTGQYGPARYVASHPKFIFPHNSEADYEVFFRAKIQYARKLFHLVPLWNEPAYFFWGDFNFLRVVKSWVN